MDDTTGPAHLDLVMTPAAASRRMTALAFGPVLTVLALLLAASEATFVDTYLTYGLWAAVVLWSPLPMSVPAVLLDHDRDMALPHLSRTVRVVALVPWMLTRSPARTEMRVSVVLWAALLALVACGMLG